MKHLTAYQIKWSVVTLDSKLTKSIIKKASKFGYTQMSGALVRHSGKEDVLLENESKLISMLRFEDKQGRATIITDKQFGLACITFDSSVSVPAPFTRAIALLDGYKLTAFPVTENQLKHQIRF